MTMILREEVLKVVTSRAVVFIFRLHPKKALQDFSISLLLDDSDDNVLAHLHRGILYNDIGK